MTTPADELRAAAEKLRQLVTFLGDNRGPWYVTTGESGYPQSISNKGVPYCVADCHESPNIPVFTIAPYIATMHPGVGKALADWLTETHTEVTAAEGTEYALHPNGGVFTSWEAALAVARAINGSEQR
ncbi:hypothetical protein ACFVYV_43405 [Streptomyces mirabilis]|uniref:hypothetical protein n=1 Tax=Streptomyces mirabilis TaxID=68239 RepID=UPI0036DA957C